jgi:hypothetical protein
MAAPVLERWVRAGNLARLEDALLEGRGHRVMKLLANAAQTNDFKEFIDRAPGFMVSTRNYLLCFFFYHVISITN